MKIKGLTFKELIHRVDLKIGFSALERLLSKNWLNPIATVYLNLRSFPLAQAIKMPVWVYGCPRFYELSGRMFVEGKVSSGMVRFNQVKLGAPSNMSVKSEILNKGLIIFHGMGLIGTGNKIVVGPKGTLKIGKNFKIADMCNIGCFKEISIGKGCRIAHRCQVFDSNYHFVANFVKGVVPGISKPISIGKGCWICNSSIITGNVVLPDYTIVASNSLVNKDMSDIPESSMIGGIPAKLMSSGFRRIENNEIENEIIKFYNEKHDGMFKIPKDATMEEYSFVDKYK